MNRIIKREDSYFLVVDGSTEEIACLTWFEKKTGSTYVKLPKDNPTGRTYVNLNHFKDKDEYEFEDKTEFRTGLSSGGWKARMTEDEKAEMAKLEARIEEIKTAALSRPIVKIDPNSPEGLKARIEKLKAELAKAEGKA